VRQQVAHEQSVPLETVTLETVFMELTGRSIEEDEDEERAAEQPTRGEVSVHGD
jgi:hypothetical protein